MRPPTGKNARRWVLAAQQPFHAYQPEPARGGPITTGESVLIAIGPPVAVTGWPSNDGAQASASSGVGGPNVALRRWATDAGTSTRLA